MRSAVDLEKRMMVKSNASKALKDLLGKVVAEYNRMVTVKKHEKGTMLQHAPYLNHVAKSLGFIQRSYILPWN